MERGLAARNGGRAGLAALVAILLLGFGLRVGYAWDGRAPVYDAQAYAAIAASLDEGRGFTVGPRATQPSSNYSPGLPLAAAAVYEASGGVHERVARVLLALLGGLAVLFTYAIGRRLGGVAAGLIGALAVAVYPAFLEYQGMLMSEPLAATLLSGAVLALFWAWDGSTDAIAWRGWLVAGLALGGLALVRPEYLAVGVLLAVVVFFSGALSRPRSLLVAQRATSDERGGGSGWLAAGDGGSWEWRRWFGRAAIVLAGIAVVVVPWTVRNAVALDRFVPISTGGGQVLFAGTYLPSDGDPEKVGAVVVAENPQLFSAADARELRLEQILARLAAATYPDLESNQALARMGREQLWDDISEEPGEYARFLARKVGRIWSHGPRDVMREPVWEALHWALVGFGLVGLLVLAWRRRWEALVLATVFLSITAVSALLVASPRRVLVMVPLVAALAGLGAAWLWDQRWRHFPHPGVGKAANDGDDRVSGVA
jgi:Dolichyl-phosphate-mannose-protein mannosyltransferase